MSNIVEMKADLAKTQELSAAIFAAILTLKTDPSSAIQALTDSLGRVCYIVLSISPVTEVESNRENLKAVITDLIRVLDEFKVKGEIAA